MTSRFHFKSTEYHPAFYIIMAPVDSIFLKVSYGHIDCAVKIYKDGAGYK